MKIRPYFKQIAYSIILFGYLLGLFYLKSIYLTLQVDLSFWLQYVSTLILGLILGSNWLIHLSEYDVSWKIKWNQLLFLSIPAAILYVIPYIYFIGDLHIAMIPLFWKILLAPEFTKLSGLILGYSLTSSLQKVPKECLLS